MDYSQHVSLAWVLHMQVFYWLHSSSRCRREGDALARALVRLPLDSSKWSDNAVASWASNKARVCGLIQALHSSTDKKECVTYAKRVRRVLKWRETHGCLRLENLPAFPLPLCPIIKHRGTEDRRTVIQDLRIPRIYVAAVVVVTALICAVFFAFAYAMWSLMLS
jgi:hypothetical protein